jgi:glycosyltransferase involved in cell wall biosynthesis
MRIIVNDHAGHPFQVQLSRKLAERGHTVQHLYCASVQTPHGALEKRPVDPTSFKVSAIRLSKQFNRYGLIFRWRQEKLIGRKLVKMIRSYSPNVIVSANTPLFAQAALINESRILDAKFIYWVQDLLGIGIRTNLKKKLSSLGLLMGKYFQFFEKQLFMKSDHIVLISKSHEYFIPDKMFAENKVSVIENWAPLDEITPMAKQNNWSEMHGLDKKFCFLYAGTLGMKHNPELLLKLAIKLKNHQDCVIVVISEGLGANYLSHKKKQYALDNLILMGFQPYEQFSQILGTADVLLSILEPDAGVFAVPSKVLTYLCARKPLLLAVPQENLAAQIVINSEAGIVVSPTDEMGFINAALQLMDNKELRNRYAINGHDYAIKTFDIDKITDKFEAIIQKNVERIK